MRTTAVLIVSAAINASTIPAVAAETSIKDIDVLGARRATAVSQSTDATDTEKTCRGYAASFQRSEMRRQAATRLADGGRTLILLDSVINGVNDLLATKCGG